MVGWFILGGIVLLILIVWLLPVAAEITFGQELRVTVGIGPVTKVLLPAPERAEKSPKKTAAKKKTAEKPKGKKKLPFTFSDVRSATPVLMEALKKALGKIRRRMRVDPMHLSFTFAGDDPVEAAEVYGWANTVVWTLMPPLEQLIRIPDPYIHLDVDYGSCQTKVEGHLGIRARLGDLVVIALTMALPILKWFTNWRKEVRGREENRQTASETNKETKSV